MTEHVFKNLPLIDIGGIWHQAYFVGLSVFLIVFCWKFQIAERKLPIIFRYFWGYVLIESLFYFEYPHSLFGIYTASFQATSAQVFAEALLIPAVAALLITQIYYVIPGLAALASLCVWFRWPGLMHSPSFNMALAACCIPALPKSRLGRYLTFGVILTVLTHHGSTALVIIWAQVLAAVLKKKIHWAWLAVALLLAAASAVTHKNQAAFNSGERIEHWINYAKLIWSAPKYWLLGRGPGTFMWYSIAGHKYQTGIFLQLYNEYLQILGELGIAGFGLMSGAIYHTVKKAWKQDLTSLQGIFSCLAFAFTFGNLRYFPSALLTAWYFIRVLVVENVNFKFPGFVRAVEGDDA